MRSPGRALHAHQLSPKSTMSGKRYKGVRMRSWGKWVSEIRIPNSRNKIWLGSYSSPEEAARAYDAAATSLRGSSSSLNFPDSPPQIVPGSLTPRSIQATAAAAAAAVAISVETNPNSSSDVAGSAYKSECSSSSSSDLVIYSANMQRMDDQSPITLPANVFNGVEPLEEPCRIQESTHLDALAQPRLETPNSTLVETNEQFSASGNIFEELYRVEQEMSCLQDLENHGLVAISDPVTSSHRFDIDSGMWMETSLWSL